jgi:Aminoglycoside adenylyltransferase, C-terminal domain/Nucleotidyltransferase domain
MVDAFVRGLRELFGDHLVGVYRHGSEVLGGGGPRSDVDVLAVVARPIREEERARLVALCRTVPRLEFDLVVASSIRPWRHPAPYEFHYWAGRGEGIGPGTNADLAAVVTMVLAGNRTLYGPPPADVLDAVPRGDYLDGILRDADDASVLMVTRVWAGVSTDDVHSKLRAAEWALPRLPDEHKPVLEQAVAFYRGERDDPPEDAEAYLAFVRRAIRRASTP